ncbi:hypothetical protein GA0070564_102114 [Micromonospora mirobrigensis]|uniref:Uncharacterized protein n=2 Tax=Micromonospora mirobrigensis TaxID=262898 RepID=A0A1C4WA17_9ACTN|nr:hypothetical protein GA0070564_102114 [Micromonospora mirobrigensis]
MARVAAVTAVLVAVLAGAVAPAYAANPIITRNNLFLGAEDKSSHGTVILLPIYNRRITLRSGTYNWSNKWDGVYPKGNSRDITLAGDDYDWNCVAYPLSADSGTYNSYCTLTRVSTQVTSYTPTLYLEPLRWEYAYGEWGERFNWSSVLVEK